MTKLPAISLLLGVTLLVYYALLVLGTQILFITGGSINVYFTILIAIFSLIFFFIAGKRLLSLDYSSLGVAFFVLVAILVFSTMVSHWFYDLSWDGQDYQQKAIFELQHGWNPISQLQKPEAKYYNQWLNHYPKAPWIAAASINQLTGDIEDGKTVNLLLLIAVFLIAFTLFQSLKIELWVSALIAVLIALNPVSVYQTFSYYVDGQVASIIAILILSFFLAMYRPSLLSYLALVAALIVALNIKFTSAIYAIVLSAGLLVLQFIYPGRGTLPKQTLRVVLAGLVLGFVVAGFQPYVTNTFRNGNPFYPTIGGNEFSHRNLIVTQMPDDFKDKNSLEKLFLSTFSPSSNSFNGEIRPKIPLSFSRDEVNVFLGYDVRVGGFGPWFGGGIILACVTCLFLLTEKEQKKKLWMPSFLLIFIVMASVFVNTESWWARYSPQLWLIPVIIILTAYLLGSRTYTRWSAYILMGVLLVNIIMVSSSYVFGSIRQTRNAVQTFEALAERDEKILVYYGTLQMIELKLKKWHIQYEVVKNFEDLPCPQPLIPFASYSFESCQTYYDQPIKWGESFDSTVFRVLLPDGREPHYCNYQGASKYQLY